MLKRKRSFEIFTFTGAKRFKIDTMYGKKRTIAKARRQFGKGKGKNSIKARVSRLEKRIESKIHVDDYAQVDIATNPLFDEITSFTQGATEITRVGNQINPTYFEWKVLFGNANDAETIGALRFMIVQSRTNALVVGDMPAAVGEAPNPDLYNVLIDTLMAPLYAMSTSSGTEENLVAEGNLVLKNAPGVKQTVQYDGSTAASTNGGIYIFAIAVNAACDVLDGYGLLRYKDG